MENLIKSLGEPIDGNEYILKPINGEWWIEHKHVGSGEPLIQWLKSELRQPPVIGSVCDGCGSKFDAMDISVGVCYCCQKEIKQTDL